MQHISLWKSNTGLYECFSSGSNFNYYYGPLYFLDNRIIECYIIIPNIIESMEDNWMSVEMKFWFI